MKKTGFTLIELIGTVVILAIIALVAFPAILSVLKQGEDQVDDSVKEIVESACNNYVNDNLNDYPKQLENETTQPQWEIMTADLVDNGYLEQSIYDKYTELEGSCVIVTSNTQRYFYTFKNQKDC